MRILKFLITGGVGLSVNLGTFHVLYLLRVPFLIGSISALLVAMFVGFVLQKYWTFEEPSQARARIQFILYASLSLCNLGINTLIVYVLVEHANLHYLIAQTMGAGFVACISYVAYKRYIFTATSPA